MTKSPVAGAGNVNMKGKKYKLMYCGCCDCIDFRDKELKKEHAKIMAEEIAEIKYNKETSQKGFDDDE